MRLSMMSVKANIPIALWLKRFAHHLNITSHLIVISANWVYSYAGVGLKVLKKLK